MADPCKVIQAGEGRVVRACAMACCGGKPKHERYSILPCGCHGLIVECTCKVRDKQCKRCGRVYVAVGRAGWAEIEDPHQVRGVTKGIKA